MFDSEHIHVPGEIQGQGKSQPVSEPAFRRDNKMASADLESNLWRERLRSACINNVYVICWRL